MRFLICSICFLVFSPYLNARDLIFKGYKINPDSTTLSEETIYTYTIADSILDKLPFKNQNNLNRIYPGVVSYFQDFYIRGGESYETGFFIEGSKFNDLFSGKNSFFINPTVFEQIEFYNGFISADFGNVSSGLFNYQLKSGGKKLEFEAEYLSDNITLTNDPYSGNKRLGAYFYGYNETSISLGGPLYFDNVKFYTSINYLFQRDKNPQRYPGVDRQFNNGPYYPDTLQIYLPAGIVNLNSLECFSSVSTLDFEFDAIKIRAYGIYFDENTFVERNHILQYLNPRAGLVDKNGGIFNIKLDHQLNEMVSYSLNANYFFKNDVTTDEFLGDDYWSYGDSVANANAGVVWNRTEQEIASNWFGRFQLPLDRNISGWAFEGYGYPSIDHKKSEQSNISLNAKLNAKIKIHSIHIGGDVSLPDFRFWYISGQRNLSKNFYYLRSDTSYQSYTDNQIKEIVLTRFGVYNIGYDKLGNKSNSTSDNFVKPISYAFFIEDNFRLFDEAFVKLGLRFDYFNSDQEVMIDPAAPEKTINYNNGELIPDGLKSVDSYQFISPKILVSSDVTNNLKLFASYTQNVQAQPLSNTNDFIYSGYPLMVIPNNAFVGGTLKPIVTKLFELGLSSNLIKNGVLGFKYFNKQSVNRQILDFQQTNQASPYSSYYYFSDKGELSVNGLEILFTYRNKNIYLSSNFNYQKANELIQRFYPEDFTSIFSNKGKETLEAERSNNIFFNTLLSYDFSSMDYISSAFGGLSFSVFYSYQSGHPIRQTYRMNYSSFQAIPESTPSTSQIDLKIEKRFQFLSNLGLDFYIYIINLFDTKNIYDVFTTTGSVDNDGYDYIDDLVQVFGPQSKDLHKLLNTYNPDNHQQIFYGPPRQIGFGIKLNY